MSKQRSNPILGDDLFNIGLIPARYASTRFPGKPLKMLGDKPMIQWTYERACMAKTLDKVYVVTDDERIKVVVESFGGKVIMTGQCATGSDRCYEALKILGEKHGKNNMLYCVNIQGDEPLVNPGHIDLLVKEAYKMGGSAVVALASPIEKEDDVRSRATTKVVMDCDGCALYFSRAMIPHSKSGEYNPLIRYHKNCGMYAFAVEMLKLFAESQRTNLQHEEDLEQLKLMEMGHRIQMVVVPHAELGVDFPEHLERLNERLYNDDPIFKLEY